MNDSISPTYDIHRQWVEKLVDTPTRQKSRPHLPLNSSLTPHDAPTEHVLRGSRSFAARSFRSRTSGNSLRVPSNKENRSTADAENSRQSSEEDGGVPTNGSVLSQIVPNSQILRPGASKIGPSPTPSLKKKKAQAIVKAHGSPQHVRVTAGGRVVPSEQSPLCHPRYGYSAIKANGGLIKFAPNHPMGKAQWTQATQNGFVAQDVNGRLCQIVNGTILPLNEVDGALRLYVPAPNLNITSRTSSFTQSAQGRFGNNDNQRRAPSQSKPMAPPDPSLPAQTNALELEYSKLEHELKELDKTEVLHGRTMGKAAKEALVAKRRELVITLDNIRKAIKSIKSMPPPDAPTSPRATQNQHSISPVKNGLPAFLQQRAQHNNEMSMPSIPPAYGPYFGMSQPQQYSGQYGFQSAPSPEAVYNQPPLGIAQPMLFVPPPPFDGSMAPPFGTYQDPTATNGAGTQHMQSNIAAPTGTANVEARLPQTDGASSFADLHKVSPPNRSHAVDIKAPELKPACAVKSNLNPMSPAYKPATGVLQKTSNANQATTKSVKDRVPTPLSPLHQLKPAAATNKAANTTDDTISPTKKSPHLHSSSVSSFETADFFPRNTHEYSTRKYAYPESTEQSEDKENISPRQSTHDVDSSPYVFHTVSKGTIEGFKKNTSTDGHNTPAPPPGTPVNHEGSQKPPSLTQNDNRSSNRGSHAFDVATVPDRQAHNLSPKGRRQDYLFVHERPDLLLSLPSSSPEKYQSCREEPRFNSSPAGNIDFSEASRDWIEGYRAGLARKPIESDRAGDFLDGYCAGLLKSKPSNVGPSTGSPVKSVSRRPSPSVIQSRSSSRLQQMDHTEPTPARSPFENNVHSMDTLKEAVFAPQNENPLLSPAADGPHANEPPFNLGAWEKSQELVASAESLAYTRGDGLSGFPFPHRTASMIRRQGVMSEDDAILKQHFQPPGTSSESLAPRASAASELSGNHEPHQVASLIGAMRGLNLGTPKKSGDRVASVTSIDSNIYCRWPGPRVLSNQLEWKSASSVAQAAGLASGYLANAQFGGTSRCMLQHINSKQAVADAQISSAGQPTQRPDSIAMKPTMQNHSRFDEGSLDGITNPPNSPQLVSPPMSPSLPGKGSPTKEKKNSSPSKGISPAKIKFETLAEKVGIKVSGGKKEDGGSSNSPPGKRRWRAIWRGSRYEQSKDDGTFVTYT